MTTEEIIEAVEKEIRETPYHKGTEHHIGMLRARLSRLRERLLEAYSRKSGGGGGYSVKKQGDATIVLIGPPSAGKSTLLNKLTNAQSKVAPYAFTTVSVIPGMMYLRDAKIQILDVPGLIEGAEEGKGRGREVLSVARGADLLIIMSDVKRPIAIERIKKSLEKNGIRLNKEKPNIRIERKLQGGILIKSNIRQNLTHETIKKVANELGVKNADITLNEKLTIEQLIDAFSANRVYTKCFNILNKADEISDIPESDYQNNNALLISAEKNIGIEELKEKIWKTLAFIRVYLVRNDEEPNLNNPLVTTKNKTLFDIALEIGSEFAEDKTRAKIWGTGAKFPGQEVSLSAKAQDGMQIRFI
ncbi:MAG: GTP-binding protein [Candidatus Woesebacteria bacterium GW2011_GWA1_37_8]|uniref:GTP-binding protein n=1 Tax=Candidatus Woesebacteria bacterium GW2011_GWA1_37_8 TaxID=1618546 RepID=A0A0G0I3X3_9BACT|nr:MAG: GTP-binding protein [Candidatus Woesebacteria bacterium GW2011_GWA1_37_8]